MGHHTTKALTDVLIRLAMTYKFIRTLITTNLITVVALLIIITPIAKAAEITPDPSTYSYGSTSEFSQSKELKNTTPSLLANTGENILPLIFSGIGLVSLALFIKINKRHKLYKYKNNDQI